MRKRFSRKRSSAEYLHRRKPLSQGADGPEWRSKLVREGYHIAPKWPSHCGVSRQLCQIWWGWRGFARPTPATRPPGRRVIDGVASAVSAGRTQGSCPAVLRTASHITAPRRWCGGRVFEVRSKPAGDPNRRRRSSRKFGLELCAGIRITREAVDMNERSTILYYGIYLRNPEVSSPHRCDSDRQLRPPSASPAVVCRSTKNEFESFQSGSIQNFRASDATMSNTALSFCHTRKLSAQLGWVLSA